MDVEAEVEEHAAQTEAAIWKSTLTTTPWDYDFNLPPMSTPEGQTRPARDFRLDVWEKRREAELAGAEYLMHMVDSCIWPERFEDMIQSVADHYFTTRLKWWDPLHSHSSVNSILSLTFR